MVLLRGRQGGGRPPERSGRDLEGDLAAPPSAGERRLPRSPIYLREDDVAEVSPGSVDLIARAMRDGKFHEVAELLGRVPAAELARGLGDLLDAGHALDRAGDALRLRARGDREPRQRLVEILDGVALEIPRAEPPRPEREDEPADFDVEEDGSPGAGAGSLVLSDPPGSLSMSLTDWATTTRAILARRGAGKTYFAGVMLEEVLSRPEHPSVVVLDPGGVWWGLLSTAEGEASSLDLLLLGGPRGHLPVGAGDGARVAEVVEQLRPRAVVVDLSDLVPIEQHELVADFADRLWSLPKFPVHLVVDEADEFVPQRFGALPQHQRRCLDFLARIFMRGRARGMAGTLISLRPAVVAKNLLSQVEELFVGRLGEPHDLAAARGWLEDYEHHVTEQQRESCLIHLPVLPTGTMYYLRGGEHPAFRRFRVRPKRTYDSSRALSEPAFSATLARPSPRDLETVREILSRRAQAGDDEDSHE